MSLAIVATAAMVGCALAASAALGAADIEGVWSFNGGTVDVQMQPSGTFRGVVVSPTQFAQCAHPVNEDMWTAITAQAGGSYWGWHQWYFEGQPCVANPKLGPTAWRVMKAADGSRFLRVCFSAPDSGLQPTIAPDGSSAHVTFGCVDSGSIAPLPGAPAKEGAGGEFEKTVVLPRPSKCLRRRTLKIRLHEPRFDPLKRAVVWVDGRKVLDVRSVKRLRHAIVIGHLPAGAFTVRVLTITVLDHRLSGKRTYTSCLRPGGKRHGRKHRRRHHHR